MAREPEPTTLERGLQHLQANDPQGAVNALQQAVVVQPNKSEGHVWLADAFMRLGMIDQSIAALVNAAQVDPQNADIRYKLGIAYYWRGMPKESHEQLQAALTLDPNHQAAQQALAAPNTMPFIAPEPEEPLSAPSDGSSSEQGRRPWRYVRYEVRGYLMPGGHWLPINTVSSRRCANCYDRPGVRNEKLEVRTSASGETAIWLAFGVLGAYLWRQTVLARIPVSYTPMLCGACRKRKITVGILAAVIPVVGIALALALASIVDNAHLPNAWETAAGVAMAFLFVGGLCGAIWMLVRLDRQKGMVIAKHSEYDVVFAFRDPRYALNFCRMNGVPPVTMSQKQAKRLGIL